METKPPELPSDLLQVVSGLNPGDLPMETAKLLALKLFREDEISMGRAAELCHTTAGGVYGIHGGAQRSGRRAEALSRNPFA